ncbi:N-acetyltransferase ESCO1 [Anomaloglossus baeobatrachus]|uniref:N-acetyltransferase ESCO1 n=1 Tax=Anomaloglossus baeobatrachus TaxID=238106 RepID=UPI003F50A2DE
MASKKRKSSLPETPVKRQKLKETKGPPANSKRRNGVTNKSKQGSTQSKKKLPAPTSKAIKKAQTSQTEGGCKKKNGNVKVTKKNNGRNVPGKQKALPKDGAASQRSTTKATKSGQPSSARKTTSRTTSVQSKTRKIVKSLTKSQSAKRIKNEPEKKTLRKPEIKSVQAKKVVKKMDKNDQTKEKKPSKTCAGKSKLTDTRTAPSIRTSAKSDCKKNTGRTTETAKKLPSTQRTKQKPSTTLRQKAVDKKKPRSTQANVIKKSTSRSGEKGKTKRDSSDLVKSKAQKPSQSSSCGTSKAAAPTIPTASTTVPLKRKRDSNKSLVKAANKAKKQKVPKLASDKNNQHIVSENDQKSKRISILDLCNEIAGEIESDTVEVVKEVPSTSIIPTETEDSPMEASPPPPSEQSPPKQSKRFFPSRKPLQLKCRIGQKTSPLAKKSKWNKIRLKNNFAQNSLLRSHTVLPNLESIKVKAPDRQKAVEAVIASKTSKKKPEVTSIRDNKQKEPVLLSQRIQNKVQLLEEESAKPSAENGLLENHVKHELEMALDEGFRLHLDSSPENSPVKKPQVSSPPVTKASQKQSSDCKQLTDQMAASAEIGGLVKSNLSAEKSNYVSSDVHLQKEIRKLKEADKNSSGQPIIDAGQKRFGVITCNVCGMLYTASNPEDETQHLLFHNQFISAVKYVGWKKERIVAEYPDGKIIMVLPDDPKYALKKVEEIREMVDNDLGFQQVPLQLHSRTKTLLFISNDKKVVGCLIAEHIQWGYRVIEDSITSENCDKDRIISERVKAWCCSTTSEPAICGVSRIWVFSMMRRKKIASRMLECLRNHFIYGSHLSKDEIAFSDPTPDGKLFATCYCGTGQFLIYNFVNGQHPMS